MQTKLTLTVDREIIESAKEYAKENAKSLSNIVEEYLKALVAQSDKGQNKKRSAIIQELKGSVKPNKEHESYKELLEDALIEKHLG